MLPAGMMPTIAAQNEEINFSTHKIVFFLGAGLLSFLTLTSLGSAIQHVDISLNSILLLICIIPPVVSLLLELLVLGPQNSLFIYRSNGTQINQDNLTYFIVGIVLIMVP